MPRYVEEHSLLAPFVLSCCGSLTRATLRLASHTPADGNNKVTPSHWAQSSPTVSYFQVVTYDEHFEICSLVRLS